jgi:hypothetical protein
VLTKYQAEKKVPWYHWEVVDAGTLDTSCCECISDINENNSGPRSENARREIYKPAPDGVRIGDKLEVTEEERVKLAAAFITDSADADTNVDHQERRQ